LLTFLVDQSNESRRYRTLVTVIDHPSLKGLRLDGQRHDTGEDADREHTSDESTGRYRHRCAIALTMT
jgi:hypothetical protein